MARDRRKGMAAPVGEIPKVSEIEKGPEGNSVVPPGRNWFSPVTVGIDRQQGRPRTLRMNFRPIRFRQINSEKGDQQWAALAADIGTGDDGPSSPSKNASSSIFGTFAS